MRLRTVGALLALLLPAAARAQDNPYRPLADAIDGAIQAKADATAARATADATAAKLADLEARVKALEDAAVTPTDPGTDPTPTPDPTPDPTPMTAAPLITADLEAAWARMVSENHPRLQFVIANAAQEDNSWGWAGQWDTLAYRMTGDPKYAAKAWTLLEARFTSANGGMRVADNWSREYFIEFAIMYTWIAPALTDAQKTQYLGWLNLFADTIVQDLPVGGADPGYTFRASDTDETIGNYLGVMIVDAIPDNPRKGEWRTATAKTTMGDLPMGGLDVSGGYDPANKFGQASLRDQVAYIGHLSRGGILPESGSYDMGTIRLWAMGTQALADLHGQDHFAELTAVVLDAARYEAARLTPDERFLHQWGDDEHPDEFMRGEWGTAMMMLAGLARRHGLPEAPQLADLVKRTIADDLFVWSRGLMFHDPYAATAPYVPAAFRAEGQGALYRPAGASKLYAQHAPNTGADHGLGQFENVRIYKDGAWVLDNPIGYGGRAESLGYGANNMVVAGGFAKMGEFAASTALVAGDGYSYAAGETHGWYYPPTAWMPPPTFVNQKRRRAVHLPGSTDVLIVRDDVDATDPRHQGYNLADRWYAPEVNQINGMAALKEQTWHAPVAPTIAAASATWAAQGGTPVRLDVLAPANPRMAVVDDHVTFGTELVASQYGYQVRVSPPTDTDGLDVFLVGLSFGATPARLTATGADGVLIERDGEPAVFCWFGPAAPPAQAAGVRVLVCTPEGVTEP